MGKYKYIKISNLNFHFGKIEKEQQIKPKGNKRKKNHKNLVKIINERGAITTEPTVIRIRINKRIA